MWSQRMMNDESWGTIKVLSEKGRRCMEWEEVRE